MARGAGVDLDIGSNVGKVGTAKSKVSDLVNSAYMPGEKGAAGQRQDPTKLMSEIRDIADATAIDVNKATDGLAAFVGKTGDLATGREMLKDLAMLSKATGTGLDDMVSAAGDVSTALGDTENKGQKVTAVMRAIAGQGKLGAVEVRDLASKMARLAAAAPQFEGDVSQNIAMMGALAQEARQRGGASSAAEASASVSGFVNTLKTPARQKQFMAAGFKKEDMFNEKGLLRDPQKIIEKSLQLKGMDPMGFKKMWSNVSGGRAVEGFANIYRQAGGGDKGMAAVREEFDRLKRAAMGEGEVAESFARRMADSDSKVQLFNNRLERITADNLPRVMDALERLAPSAASAAEGFAKFVGWASENPGTAIAGALAASIGKAAIGSVLEAGLSKALGGVGGLTLGAATIAVTAATIVLSQASAAKEAGQREVKGELGRGASIIQSAKEEYAAKGSLSPETMAALRAEKERLDVTSAKAGGKTSWVDAAVAALPGTEGTFSGKWQQLGEEHQARASASDVSMERKDINQLIDASTAHLTAAQALGNSAQALADSAAALRALVPGGFSQSATTGPTPIVQVQ